LASCEEQIYELAVNHGSLIQKLENIEEQKEELAKLQIEYAATDLFLRCMHSNGIAFDIINKALPVINEEISKVLANIVEFEVYFEKDGNKLDIFIHHPKHEARPLENGSGAEKTLAAVAIRIALLNISNMPKCNLIILDEPGAALDEEHLESFTRILDMLKSYFDIVILITHIESLKDTVDMTIDITKKNSFAYVNQ
jgi:DNA repair exonuclease SbcCD ATPase subunit